MDHRGTGLVLDYLAALAAGRRPSTEDIGAIASDPGYVLLLERTRAIIRQFGGEDSGIDGLATRELERCLGCYAEQRAWEGHRFFGAFTRALGQARQNLSRHLKVYEAIGRLEAGALETEVLNRLPQCANIDSTAYFLAEVHTDAYAFRRDVVISFWPLELVGNQPVSSGLPVAAVLKHELHHIGINSILPRIYSSDQMPATAAELALALVGALAGEGSATMFFTPYDTSEPDASSVPWEKTAQDLPLHYGALDSALSDLLGGRLGVAEGMRTIPARFLGAYEGKYRPAIYILGVDMCRRVAAERGERELIELLRTPASFFAAYNEAVGRGTGHRFSDDVVQGVRDAAARLE